MVIKNINNERQGCGPHIVTRSGLVLGDRAEIMTMSSFSKVAVKLVWCSMKEMNQIISLGCCDLCIWRKEWMVCISTIDDQNEDDSLKHSNSRRLSPKGHHHIPCTPSWMSHQYFWCAHRCFGGWLWQSPNGDIGYWILSPSILRAAKQLHQGSLPLVLNKTFLSPCKTRKSNQIGAISYIVFV